MTRCLTRAAATAAVLAALLAAILPSAVLAGTPDPNLPPAWPQDSALEYRWAPTGVPPAAIRTALLEGAADATATRASRAPSFAFDSTASNDVGYGIPMPCASNAIACAYRNVPSGFDVWIRENGHKYDWGTLRWCELNGSLTGCFSAETLMLDELGHIDGLAHHVNLPDESDYTDSVVQAGSHQKPQAGWNQSVFGVCDTATLQTLYDVPSWSTLYSTCLAIPASLTLSMSPSSAASGTVTFSASFHATDGGRLNGNPLTGRRVVLQSRSGLDWSDTAAFTSGATSGSYTANILVRPGMDYRAVFRATANEGLRTTVSAVVTSGGACTSICPLGRAPGDPASPAVMIGSGR